MYFLNELFDVLERLQSMRLHRTCEIDMAALGWLIGEAE